MSGAVNFHSALAVAYRWQGQKSSEGLLTDAFLAVMAGPPTPRPLTKRQREIFDYIAAFIAKHGYAPSFEEIAAQFQYRSLATVHEHLSGLERKGWVSRSYGESRGMRLTEEAEIDYLTSELREELAPTTSESPSVDPPKNLNP